MIRNSFLILVLGVLFASCQQEDVFNSYQKVNGAWNSTDVKHFEVAIEDTLSPHNLYLNIRNNKDYPFSNMFVIFKMELPDASVLVDTLEYEMAKADGTLLGSGFSDIKENKLWIKEGYVFPKKGTYAIEISQALREPGVVEGVAELKGISEVGIQIEKFISK